MKREAFEHPKIKLLARDLQLPMCYARGVVESLWGFTGISFPRGDIGRLTNEEIVAALDYPGDPDHLVESLLKRRLLDPIPTEQGRLYVHDWHEHCDRHTNLRNLRAKTTFANGMPARTAREQDSGASDQPRTRVNASERECARVLSIDAQPEPEPEPLRTTSSDSQANPSSNGPFKLALVNGSGSNGTNGHRRETEHSSVEAVEKRAAVRRVWNYYIKRLGKNQTILELTEPRIQKGLSRLREARLKVGGDMEKAEKLLQLAVDALAGSEHHAGANDRSKRYDSWEKNLFPSQEKFEWWLERAQSL